MKLPPQIRYFAAVCALLISGVGMATAQDAAPMKPSEVVKTHTFVSLDRVPRGKTFQAAIVVDIAENYHMNSHTPAEAYLIPTTLTPQLPPGLKLVDTLYPPGHLKKFPFSPDTALNVYSGSVTLRLKLAAEDSASLGATTIPMVLRYQACNNSACLPPVKIPVTAELQIAAAGTASHPAHAEVFAAAAAQK
jgi:DsbC/DsbD-like thiol-disulfide interchange protein